MTWLKDFLMFRGFIVPTIVRVLFWLGLVFFGLVALGYIGGGVRHTPVT